MYPSAPWTRDSAHRNNTEVAAGNSQPGQTGAGVAPAPMLPGCHARRQQTEARGQARNRSRGTSAIRSEPGGGGPASNQENAAASGQARQATFPGQYHRQTPDPSRAATWHTAQRAGDMRHPGTHLGHTLSAAPVTTAGPKTRNATGEHGFQAGRAIFPRWVDGESWCRWAAGAGDKGR